MLCGSFDLLISPASVANEKQRLGDQNDPPLKRFEIQKLIARMHTATHRAEAIDNGCGRWIREKIRKGNTAPIGLQLEPPTG